MTDYVVYFAFRMFMSTALGFMIGDAFGESVRHRKCLEEANQDLRDQLRGIHACQSSVAPNPDSSAAFSAE